MRPCDRTGDRDQAGAGSLALSRTTSTREQRHEHEVADEDEPGRRRIEALHELPVVRGNHNRVNKQASRSSTDATVPRRPGTITTIASNQTRNCGDRTLPNATKATAAAAAYRANRAADSRVAAAIPHPDEHQSREADDRRDAGGDAGYGAGQVLRARSGGPRERHARSVVEREQHARAETLDLQRPPELPPDAACHTLGRDEQRRGDRRRAPRRSSAPTRPERRGATVPSPGPGCEEGQENGRVDLRRDREAEQDRPECRRRCRIAQTAANVRAAA